MEQDQALSWEYLWGMHDEAERQQALFAYAGLLRNCSSDMRERYCMPVLKELSKLMRFRPQSLQRMSTSQIAESVRRHIQCLFDSRDWNMLFSTYYTQHKREMLCRFLDLLGVKHDEYGRTSETITTPQNLDGAVHEMVSEFGSDQVVRYFSLLLLHSEASWGFLREAIQALQDGQTSIQVTEQTQHQEQEHDVEPSHAEQMSESFTQLDRVLIDQVIATVAQEERALSPQELADLIETVHALDTARRRSYFHLGFMDAMVPGRDPEFERPEMEDLRKEWYLTGLLTGYARKRDHDALRGVLNQRREDFMRAAARRLSAGESLARTVYARLLELDLFPEALALLKGQGAAVGRPMLNATFGKASELLRAGDVAGANILLIPLNDVLGRMAQDSDEYHNLRRGVRRRLGQVAQAKGDFAGAAAIFRELLDETGAVGSPDFFSDLGLVQSGFRSLAEVSLPEDVEHREVIRKALDKGKAHFESAALGFGVLAVNANYALGLYHYLSCIDPKTDFAADKSDIDKALHYVNDAITGMASADNAESYEKLGLLGRARFMQAVLLVTHLDHSILPAALNAWTAIDSGAGKLPVADLRHFIESVDTLDRPQAISIAEAIWRHRRQDALAIIHRAEWVTGSAFLQEELLDLVKSHELSSQLRWDLWSLLVPALLRAGKCDLAQQGIDTMESLALDSPGLFAVRFVDWLAEAPHYDPALTEEDVYRIRYRLYRCIGQDAEAACQLRELFYRIRDKRRDEAQQILDLLKDSGVAPEHWSDLTLPIEDSANGETAIEDRLSSGERVRLLFVGGNETQAQYDDQVLRDIQENWPGIEIVFEHTGWSSNWGREVDRLMRLATQSDAVVLMTMMRTMLGRTLREKLNDPPRPWVPCTGTGKVALERSLRTAAIVGLKHRSH